MSQIQMKNPKKRVTMIKHVVGKVRTQPDPIPNITFGIPNKIDEEGAGNVIQSWAQSQPNLKKSSTASNTTVVASATTTNSNSNNNNDNNNNNNNNNNNHAMTTIHNTTTRTANTESSSQPTSYPLSSSPMYRHFPATNRKALKNGCFNAKSQREFALKHPVMKSMMKTSSHNHHHLQKKRKEDPNFEPITTQRHNQQHQQHQQVFGIRSIANDVPIQELLKSVHGDFEESDYPDRSHMQKKGRLPPAKSTNASRLLEASIHNNNNNMNNNGLSLEEKAKTDQKNCFKMKRFLKVDSTVKAMLQQ